ncbi:MAG: hypothetical protein QOJ09_750, partial [Actinomycetota bacterium]|nr:hypothetical protein [Actinomycetota bacterium]
LLLDLVEHLVEWTRTAPVLLLALARPELREMRPALVETGGRAALVAVLEGLDPAASERLACDLLDTDELPPALVTRILTGSEGNPLFVRELVRMLVDDGVLRRHGSGWRSTIEVDAITVPPTIQSLMAARVERLPADERAVLECAAVVGREFYRGAVVELLPTSVRGELGAVLERLRQKEMVEPEGTYWIDEPVLRFHHVLLRDAAYRRLLKEVRADLHERYAGWLEAKTGDGTDTDDEVLGYHLEQAHQYRVELGLFDDHTALLGHQAAGRLAGAGRRALDRDDLPAAAGLLGRALARVDGSDPERPGLLIDSCEALLATGALAEGVLAVAQLRELAGGSPRLRAWAACFEGQLATLTDPGRLRETAEAVAAAADELSKLADAAGAAKAHSVHAAALARLGRVAECEMALDRALAAAREAGDSRRATAVLAGAPLAALWGPSPVARASGRCLDVVRVLRITTSATTVEATSLRCQAVLEALRGRTDAARRMLGAARSSLEELGHRHGLLSTDMFSGLVELLADDAAAAEAILRTAHAGFRELGVDVDAAQAAALLARALLAQGRAEEAEALTFESERLGGADIKTAISWRAVRAEALAQRGAVDEALALARAAVALAEPTDALLDQADTHLALATVLQIAGRAAEAVASASRAAELYERKGATVLAERATGLLGRPPGQVANQDAAAPGGVERLGELTTHTPAPSTVWNTACELAARLMACLPANDWAAVADVVTAGVVLLDNRPGLRTTSVGTDAFVAWARALALVRTATSTPLAVRGDGLALVAVAVHGQDQHGGDFEAGALVVVEIDESHRIDDAALFDTANVKDAMQELDARFTSGQPAAASSWAAGLAFVDYYNSRDWQALEDLLTDDFVVVDTRPAGFGALDRTGFMEWARTLVAMAPDLWLHAAVVHALTPDGWSVLVRNRGSVADGGSFELERIVIGTVRDGRLARLEFSLPEATDEAVARLTELTAKVPHEARYARSGDDELREVLDVVEAFAAGVTKRDAEGIGALYDPGASVVDHRPAGWGAVGRDEYVGLLRSLFDLTHDFRAFISSMPRLSHRGAVITLQSAG